MNFCRISGKVLSEFLVDVSLIPWQYFSILPSQICSEFYVEFSENSRRNFVGFLEETLWNFLVIEYSWWFFKNIFVESLLDCRIFYGIHFLSQIELSLSILSDSFFEISVIILMRLFINFRVELFQDYQKNALRILCGCFADSMTRLFQITWSYFPRIEDLPEFLEEYYRNFWWNSLKIPGYREFLMFVWIVFVFRIPVRMFTGSLMELLPSQIELKFLSILFWRFLWFFL